jgi:uncharacterized RDD family membrane protein YckC
VSAGPCHTARVAVPPSPLVAVGHRGAARLLDIAAGALLAFGALSLTPDDRPFLGLVAVAGSVLAYELVFLVTLGATPGKLVTGLRVRHLDHPGPVPPVAALRRSAIVAGVALSLAGIPALAASSALSPLRRGFHDRQAGTVVIPRRFGPLIASGYVQQWEVAGERTPLTPLGPVASFAERRRARLRRLDHAPLLVAGVVVLVAAGQLGDGVTPVVWASAAWLLVFVADETWRISRRGQTGGHDRERVVVLDRRSGRPPRPWRSFLRAVVLAPLYYIPPLQLILGAWVRLSPHNRGPHDLAGRTVVVRLPGPG